jgi:hypothetical protein
MRDKYFKSCKICSYAGRKLTVSPGEIYHITRENYLYKYKYRQRISEERETIDSGVRSNK